MTLPADADLRLAAVLVHRSYSWLQRNWRTLTNAAGQPFPAPYIGGQPGQRPWWRTAAIEAWKDGAAPAVQAAPGPAETAWDQPQRQRPAAPANDARPAGRGRLADRLLAHAGNT